MVLGFRWSLPMASLKDRPEFSKTKLECKYVPPLTVQPPHLHCCTTMCWISQTFSPTKFHYCTNWSKSSCMQSTSTSYWGASASSCCSLVIQASPELMRAYRSAKSWNLVLSGRLHTTSQPSPKISKSPWKITHAIQCHSTALACQSAKFMKDEVWVQNYWLSLLDKIIFLKKKRHYSCSFLCFSMLGKYLIITDLTSRDTRIMTNYNTVVLQAGINQK